MPVTRPTALNPAQLELETGGYLASGFSLVLHMSTGSGKTWLARRMVEEVVQAGRRAVVVTPLRALAAELADAWAGVGAPVGVFTSDQTRGRSPVRFRDAAILVMTPERLDACGRSWRSHWNWIPEVDLVVVDEIHLIGDRSRGRRLEGAISRFRRLNPFARWVGLSATLGNPEEIAAWLGGVAYSSAWRPTPLTWRVVRYASGEDKPEVLAAEVQDCVANGGQSLVFVHSRRRAEDLSTALAALGLRVAHHHAGLNREARSLVESRMRDSTLDVLVATSTLELGVNLPVRQVVLYDTHQFDGSVFQPISVNAAWQRAGRAGRPGLDEEGEVVVLAARWDRELDQLSRGRFEPVMSALDSPSALAEQIVVEVYSDLARTNDQLERALAQSLAAHQGRLPPLLPAVASMKDAGLLAEVIDETGLRLKATQLGRVASRHMLTPASVLTLKAVLDLVSEPTFFDILIACASTPDCEPVLSVDYEELPSLAERLTSEPSHLLASPDTRVSLGIDGRRLLSALKMALVLRQWTRIGEEDDVATRFGCYPFEISALRESAERLLQALSAMVPSTDGDGARRSCAKVHALTTMIKAGLDEEMVTLALVPGIGPALARRLAAMGVSDIEALACSDAEAISSVRGVSRTRAMSWIAQAETLVGEVSAFEYREDRGPQIVTAEAWPPDVELYRFRRALDLVVEATGDDYRVSGGLDPHIIDGATLQCDCPDAAAGNACKHRLAVRLYKGDRRLRSLRRRLVRDGGLKDKRPVDLARLWLADGGAQYRSKVG